MSIGLETGPVNARMAALFGELGDGTAPSLAERVRAQRVHSVLFGTQVSTPRLGRFVVLRELGRGGMGTVYAAHDTQLDRQVAVKLLHRVSTRSRARLLREAQSMARLGHPNVVPVFELSLDSPRPFVVMQLVEGQTLGQWLRARRRDASAILSMFRQAGAGLVAAHALGMVHRDFKPSNVLIDAEGRARVTDFGLARAVDSTIGSDDEASPVETSPVLTAAGAVVGTPAYMAPEQRDGQAGPQSDQYSFCVALYEALLGTRPTHDGKGRSLPVGRSSRRPSSTHPVRRLPPRIRRVVMRGLAVDPAERWPSLQRLLDQLVVPHTRGRSWMAGAAVATAVLGTTWLASAHGQCDDPQRRLGTVWNDDTRDELAQVLRSQGPHGARAWPRVRAQVDGFTSQWLDAKTHSCHAAGSTDDVAPSLCLDRTLLRLDAAIEVLKTGDTGAIDNAALVLPSGASLDACSAPGMTSSPHDSETSPPLDHARGQLAHARAMLAAGRYDDARAHAVAARRVGREHRAPGLNVEATLVLGDIDRTEGRPDAGLMLERAYLDAAAVGAKRWATEAALGLAEHRALDHADLDSADDWLTRAGWLGAESPRDRELSLRHAGVRVNLLIARGELSEAIQQAEAADHEAWASGDPALQRRSLVMASNLGVAQLRAGRDDEAAQTMRRTLDRQRALLGSEHPALVATIVNLAAARGNLGAAEDARAWLEKADALAERSLPPTHAARASIPSMLAELARREGRQSEAHALGRRAHAALERRLPPEHPQLLASEGRRAQLRWDGGERHEALDDLVAVIDRAHAAGVAGLPLAELELQLGLWRAEVSPERARDPLLRAHEVFAAIAPEHPEAVRARLALAQLPTPRQTTAPLSEPAP